MSGQLITKSILSVASAISVTFSCALFLYKLYPGNLLTDGHYSKGANGVVQTVLNLVIDLALVSLLLFVLSLGKTLRSIPMYKPFHMLLIALSIELTNRLWSTVHDYTIWNIESLFFWKLSSFIFICSTILFVIIICTVDPFELLGLRYIFNANPMELKTPRHRTLYDHMRIPALLSPLMILWFVPIMTPDRFLLASAFSLYLVAKSRIDENDVQYTSEQLDLLYEHLVIQKNPFHEKIDK